MRRILGILVAVLGFATAQAAQLAMTRGELCELSSRVVVGEVTSRETRWVSGDSGAIERLAWISVSHDVKGAASETVEVVLPGGQLGGVAHWVEDVPQLIENGRYLLFLQRVQGRWHVTGGEQGAVRLTPPGSRYGETEADALKTLEVCRGSR